MRNSALVWEVYLQAKAWRKLPSEVLFMDPGIEAFHLNRSVWMFGLALEAELNAVESDNKNPKLAQREIEGKRAGILEKWIPKAKGAPESKPKQRFADPAAMVRGR